MTDAAIISPYPSQYPFSDSETKIKRARKHLSELEIDTKSFIESKPATFSTRLVDSTIGRQRIEIYMELERLSPADLSAIIGDIIHNLRSALDLMSCDLVRLAEPGADVRNVYFPFCDHPNEPDKMIRRRNFHRAGAQAVAMLLDLKPYRGRNSALRAIHDPDIQDKHQALILAPMAVGGPVIKEEPDNNGTSVFTIVGDPTLPSELVLTFPKGGPLAGIEILPGLERLIELTVGIIESFKTLSRS